MILAVSVALNMGLSDMCQSRQLFTRARAQHIPSHSGLHKSDLGWRLVCIFVQFLKGTLLVEIREGPPRNSLGVFEQCFLERVQLLIGQLPNTPWLVLGGASLCWTYIFYCQGKEILTYLEISCIQLSQSLSSDCSLLLAQLSQVSKSTQLFSHGASSNKVIAVNLEN